MNPLQLDIKAPEITEARPEDLDLVFGPPERSRDDRIALKRKLLRASEPIAGGDWDIPAPRRFTDLEVYKAIEDRVTRGVPWQETLFYKRVIQDFKHGRRKWGCSTEAEFIARCKGLDDLHRAIANDGYRSQVELGTNRTDNEVRVAICRDGRLLFIDGRHRLAIARVLGVERIPVRIVARHTQWAAFKKDVLDYAATRHGRIYQTIDHPDLRHVPAGHGTERIKIIEAALQPYRGNRLSLLDIGAHWGYMCQQLERLDFSCHGIELNRQSAEFAKRISVATNSKFTIWRGSIFEQPNVADFDVVLALNIFHHFIKTKTLHTELQRLLERLRPNVMIFEAHKHDPPAQMAGAYRNYPPDEFADFVSRCGGFSQIERIGAAPDGRRLFKLIR